MYTVKNQAKDVIHIQAHSDLSVQQSDKTKPGLKLIWILKSPAVNTLYW